MPETLMLKKLSEAAVANNADVITEFATDTKRLYLFCT
jgi:hypothetical protein